MTLLLYINCWELGFHVSWRSLVKIWTLSILYASCIMTLFLYTNSWEFRFHVSWRILFKILDPVYLYASCIITLSHVRLGEVGRSWPRLREVGCGWARLGGGFTGRHSVHDAPKIDMYMLQNFTVKSSWYMKSKFSRVGIEKKSHDTWCIQNR